MSRYEIRNMPNEPTLFRIVFEDGKMIGFQNGGTCLSRWLRVGGRIEYRTDALSAQWLEFGQ